ncbi:CDP-diacylglycerol--glycerol-3-phosphate 3-phosphatidyltransferase [Bifidobacterium bohemicum]|uniref:CDP-diacylglycerol--glycerol-3-phosphate 3-phosphatidyltransferase n=2 Tax=Bifidobacterium bohemicum TaxID=638617 RepID=A0A086ZG54_9BIFI|nr:CDP-diacylglycerol--glycerol-3-phosphate 3-phosphatidyltransferase [Bifidobacterium bohemicum]KFI45504.1 CDP-diacylglycerol--glycerol-3-phosphate 3-phosphatidyltransferase [Bifidobacterium bohemicum DSM 22767]SCB71742.1 CDP-diacylglycerol--glycerol-3-phosphate 3-phosphatidyltransferase [Bifidobacterium bohemicum]
MQQREEHGSLLDGWNAPPNLVTYSRIVLVLIFLWADIASGPWGVKSPWLRFAAAILFIVAASTDKLDGWMARKYNQVTELGKLMDPIADKLLICSALVVASVFGEVPWWITALFLIREIGITVMRFFVIDTGGTVIAAATAGKLKTLTECVGLGMLLMPVWALSNAVKDPGLVSLPGGGPTLAHLGTGAPNWWFGYYALASLIIMVALVLCLYSGYVYVHGVVQARRSS